jgi:hypothetical protein
LVRAVLVALLVAQKAVMEAILFCQQSPLLVAVEAVVETTLMMALLVVLVVAQPELKVQAAQEPLTKALLAAVMAVFRPPVAAVVAQVRQEKRILMQLLV